MLQAAPVQPSSQMHVPSVPLQRPLPLHVLARLSILHCLMHSRQPTPEKPSGHPACCVRAASSSTAAASAVRRAIACSRLQPLIFSICGNRATANEGWGPFVPNIQFADMEKTYCAGRKVSYFRLSSFPGNTLETPLASPLSNHVGVSKNEKYVFHDSLPHTEVVLQE